MGALDFARLTPDRRLKVGGKALPLEVEAALARIEIDLDAELFGQCRLHFVDPGLELIDGKQFQSGTPVEVELGFQGKFQHVFSGEVVALEPQFRRDLPPSLVVTCYDPLHRLALAQMTRALNDAHDGDVVEKIAQEHGLSCDAPSGTPGHSLQNNLSDMTFLRRIAQKNGHHVRLVGTKLVVGPLPRGAELTLTPGEALRKLKVKIKSNRQVQEVTVHGWDAQNRREIVGRARPEGETGQGARDHGSGTLSIAGTESGVPDVATAEAMARGRLRKLAEGFVVAQGEMVGDARVVPGAELSLAKMGPQIDGRYRVGKAAHLFDKHGWRVTFRAARVGKPRPAPRAAPAPQRQDDEGWLELELVDHENQPIAFQAYRVCTSDGRVVEGRLDDQGRARVEGVRPGNNTVSFPGFSTAWQRM